MSTKNPCYVIEFGTRRVEFFPLLLKDVRALAEMPDEVGGKPVTAYDKQFQSYLLSAQRGDPALTMEDIVPLVDTSHARKLSRAIYALPPEEPTVSATAVPTSPQIGG